ncbi:hypothetical protein [Herpetosiphon giganteus]|uniref:hypothetical protein n=1 Tax=Herpetosiphon giganteus TaxID=2029754 RepID=UPI00195C30AA|nr:hypothetical protein [Herpetosiphon giganteus]MBM7845666.1 hypothetical protein [Herpetosiphon giganteus]
MVYPTLDYATITTIQPYSLYPLTMLDLLTDDLLALAERLRADGYHCVVLDGTELNSKLECHLAFAYGYDFEGHNDYHGIRNPSWDAFISEMRCAGSVIEHNQLRQRYRGFVLVYLHPERFFKADVVNFAMLLDILIGTVAEHYRAKGIPFNVVLSPINKRMYQFLNTLKISDRTSAAFNPFLEVFFDPATFDPFSDEDF